MSRVTCPRCGYVVAGNAPRWCPTCGQDLSAPTEALDPDAVYATWAHRRSLIQAVTYLGVVAAVAGVGLALAAVKGALDRGAPLEEAVTLDGAGPRAAIGIAIVVAAPVAYGTAMLLLFRCPACGGRPFHRSRVSAHLPFDIAHRGDPDDGASPTDPIHCPHCRIRLR